MVSKTRMLKVSRFDVSQIPTTGNNRLVELGDSFLAMLDQLPPPPSRSEASVELLTSPISREGAGPRRVRPKLIA